MTCSDVMTTNPSCCVPSDSVAMAAQIIEARRRRAGADSVRLQQQKSCGYCD